MLQDVEVIEVAAPQTTSVVSSAAATVEAEPRPQTPVIDQIAESLPDVGLRVGQQIVIRLNPPHLGRVRLTLQAEGREIRGVVHVDNPRTFHDLQRETTQLASRLAEGGVQLRRLEVQLSNPDRDGQTDSTLPQYQEGRQNAPQRDAPDREGDPDGGGRLEPAPPGGEEDPLTGRADDDSINVWI